jgi:hypothetical protein
MMHRRIFGKNFSENAEILAVPYFLDQTIHGSLIGIRVRHKLLASVRSGGYFAPELSRFYHVSVIWKLREISVNQVMWLKLRGDKWRAPGDDLRTLGPFSVPELALKSGQI